MSDKITAHDIKQFILDNHTNDLAFLECKTGASIHRGMRMFDAWVMRKTWSPFTTIGYEIKVSRNDFLQDTKWPEYLNYCHQFYFVTTGKDIIDKSELPDHVGLKYISKNCKRWITKKKATHRNITIPTDIFAYIMMWRIKEFKNQSSSEYITEKETFEQRKKRWDKWLSEKLYKRVWGGNLPGRVNQQLHNELREQKERSDKIERANEKLQEVKTMMDEMGISYSSWMMREKLENKLHEIKTGVGEDLINLTESLEDKFREINKILKRGKENVSSN